MKSWLAGAIKTADGKRIVVALADGWQNVFAALSNGEAMHLTIIARGI